MYSLWDYAVNIFFLIFYLNDIIFTYFTYQPISPPSSSPFPRHTFKRVPHDSVFLKNFLTLMETVLILDTYETVRIINN